MGNGWMVAVILHSLMNGMVDPVHTCTHFSTTHLQIS